MKSEYHLDEATGVVSGDYIAWTAPIWRVECDVSFRRFGLGVHTNWSDPAFTTVFACILGPLVLRVMRVRMYG